MTTLKELDNKLAFIQMRLNDLRAQRGRLEEKLKQKGLKPAVRKSLESGLAALGNRIKSVEREEWDADDERYDLLYYRRR